MPEGEFVLQARHIMTRIDPPPEGWGLAGAGPRELAMLAHDVRGALSGVIGGIALLDRSAMDDDMRMQFDRIAAAAQALSSLVTGALSGDRGEDDGDGRRVELGGFLRFLGKRWSGEAREKGLAFGVALGAGLPASLRVEFLDLSRILGNLIGNAIKFADSGSIELSVRRDASGGILFLLRDEGPGLREGEAGRVFDYGYRSAGGKKPGDGIGLHIAKTLVERMGGRIALTNRPEGGVEATCFLPAGLCEGRSGEAEERAGGPPDLAGLRVLLAEDNPTNQMVASQMLRSMHAEVVLAADGVEALAVFEATEVDLLIVDIEMPRKSGLDVIREVRARGDTRSRTPIVALTAYAMKEHRERISEAGADGLISKPIISIEAFGRAVAAHAKARGATTEPADLVGDIPGPVVDMATYEALAQAIGAEMMAELLDRVVIDLEAAGADLRRALDPIDLGAVRAASHILISVSGAVGAVRLQSCARTLNTEAHGAPGTALQARIRSCIAEIAGAVRFVREQRAQC